ncbi:MAG: sugar 3,4-ketoisomerase [Sphingomicrobium sp.]
MDQILPERCRLLPLRVRGDSRGSLVALERSAGVPFDIARVYYIFDTRQDVYRGCHAHHQLNQLAVAVHGGCTVILDDGKTRESVRLASPDQGLLIGPMVWREIHDFTPDCVLLVLADAPYDEADYIRDLDEFRRRAGL